MFSKSKVSQSMIDAVNSVLGEKSEEKIVNNVLLDEASEKVPTPTGMKVYGSSYGNSKKARKDQTSHEIDKLKEPKAKELAKEELKGDQHKIDAQDFKILKGKKKANEELTYAKKLMEKAKLNLAEKKDVVMPEDAPATSTPKKNQDVADKSYLKDKPGVKSDLKNFGRFLTGKKETNEAAKWRSHPDAYDDEGMLDGQKMSKEEVELNEDDNLSAIAKKHGMEFNRTTYGAGMKHKTKGEISINRYGEWHHKGTKATGDSTGNFSSLDKHLSSLKEEVELDEQINEVLSKDATAGDWIHDFVHSDNPKFAGKSKAERKKQALAAYYAKQRNEEVELEEKVIAGTPGWEKQKKDVKDKSGAVHTPMSRAKDLARQSFKKLKNEMLGKAPGNN